MRPKHISPSTLSRAEVIKGISVLLVLVFSKYFYLTSLTSYYTFYLMNKFHLPVQVAQHYLFLFLAAAAAGTIFGGPIGDRIGRRKVIWGSILGVAPFTLLLPHVGLTGTGILSVNHWDNAGIWRSPSSTASVQPLTSMCIFTAVSSMAYSNQPPMLVMCRA
jgi:FSR family fosmidomycin resistance protein-like MFS transporter